jgi:hypothetical protein
LINSAGSLGGYLGPVVVGALSRPTGGFSSAYAALGCCLLAAAGLALALEQNAEVV